MLSKVQVKDIRSLAQHKYRREHQSYIVEGDKMAREWLASDAEILQVIALEEWLEEHRGLVAPRKGTQAIPVPQHVLEQVSQQDSPNKVLLVVRMPAAKTAPPPHEWCIALDRIQDPGNMGTIIRIADWFGINHIVASPDSVDFYNPKVVQSAMGGHLRVRLHINPLSDFFNANQLPVLAATLDGVNIYQYKKPEAAVLLIGNESRGVSAETLAFATDKIMIPRQGGAESLNAAVAAGIVCALLKGQ